ncbi:uncharacterized protein LOC113378000 isoform X2 [Ctenocephalides felis]|uniref:uncharacterized protein LOC113378000 isoform X2 n=1 Tax=Ctenocephalides felis TaxID=7515 RepID=UPI000E6E3FB9|nr:uncharacterized protein LOC113378000 isoform X2 [Ctenocephalides felis]
MYSVFFVFLTGVVIGLYFASIAIQIHTTKPRTVPNNRHYINVKNNIYDDWFRKSTNFNRKQISNDDLLYGHEEYSLESSFLFSQVPILCAMKISKIKNAIAANNTWLRHCNEQMFYELPPRNIRHANNSLKFNNSVSSSWHLLCNTIIHIQNTYKNKVKYVIFVNDDTFVIPENLRMVLAGFKKEFYVYMGHAIIFWGVTYNVAQSGIVLGMNVIERLSHKFKNNEECQNSGKYWKQEDWYLGKYLASMKIFPVNPNNINSNKNLSRFHGYSLEQSMFPGSQKVLSKYYKNWIHPADCCSFETITFNLKLIKFTNTII